MWTPLRRSSDDHRQPVAARQHTVDDEHVVGILGGHEETAFAVAGVIGDDARLPKRLRKIGGGFKVVFDDQNLHAGDHSPGPVPSTTGLPLGIRLACPVAQMRWA